MIEQQLVELRTFDLIGAGMFQAEPIHEKKFHGPRAAGGGELGTVLAEKSLIESFAHSEALKYGHRVGQKRFPNVEAGKPFTFEKNHRASTPGEQSGGGASGGSAADDRRIISFFHAPAGEYTRSLRRQPGSLGWEGLSASTEQSWNLRHGGYLTPPK